MGPRRRRLLGGSISIGGELFSGTNEVFSNLQDRLVGGITRDGGLYTLRFGLRKFSGVFAFYQAVV